MRARDLAAERQAALNAMTQRDIAELLEFGVPSAVIEMNMVGLCRINLVVDSRIYEPDTAGALAFITPVLVDNPATPESCWPEAAPLLGNLVDLVAWDPQHPKDWALRAEQAVWLGSVAPQYLDPEPVWIRPTVLDWFRCWCSGLVVLSRDPALSYSLLMCLTGGIWAQDETHLADLKRTLARPWPLPEVSVGPSLPWQVRCAAE